MPGKKGGGAQPFDIDPAFASVCVCLMPLKFVTTAASDFCRTRHNARRQGKLARNVTDVLSTIAYGPTLGLIRHHDHRGGAVDGSVGRR